MNDHNHQPMKFDQLGTRSTCITPTTYGRYYDAEGQRVILPFSYPEQERARRAAMRLLSSFHFRTGSNILLTSLLDQTAQIMPIERALYSSGYVAVSADASPYDAKRVESIIRRFNLTAAINITSITLEGLKGLGYNPQELFKGLIVWADPSAYETLARHANTTTFKYLEIGPATAMECPHKNGSHIDRFEWLTETIDGEIVLTSRLNRCTEFSRYKTGFHGQVDRMNCACGNPDPRIIPSA